MLNINGKSVLFLILEEKLTIEYDISCGLVIYGLYYVEVKYLFYLICWEFLIIKVCWILSILFSPQTIKTKTTILSINPTSEYILKALKSRSQRDIYIPMFMVALFIITKIWTQHKYLSMDRLIKKIWYIHKMEYYYSVLKKKEILPYGITWLSLVDIMLSEIC